MIYINRIPDQTNTTIFLSKPIYKQEGDMGYNLEITHTSTNNVYKFNGILNIVGDYYKIDFSYDKLPYDGEYEYLLTVGTETSTGLIRIGDYNNSSLQYDLNLNYVQPKL